MINKKVLKSLYYTTTCVLFLILKRSRAYNTFYKTAFNLVQTEQSFLIKDTSEMDSHTSDLHPRDCVLQLYKAMENRPRCFSSTKETCNPSWVQILSSAECLHADSISAPLCYARYYWLKIVRTYYDCFYIWASSITQGPLVFSRWILSR